MDTVFSVSQTAVLLRFLRQPVRKCRLLFAAKKKFIFFYASVTDETVYKRYTFNIDGIVYIYKLPAVPFGGANW